MSSNLINKYTCGLTLLAGAGMACGAMLRPAQGADRPLPWPIVGTTTASKAPAYMPGEAVARLAPGASGDALARTLGIHVKRQLRFAPNTYLLDGITGDVNQAVAQLNTTPGVLQAVPNLIYHGAALPPVTPNDPLYSQQWALRLLNAPTLWSVTVGERLVDGPEKNVLVGVIDSGFETAHPDLAENLDPGAYDFVRDQPYDNSQVNSTGFVTHGSNVSGVIAGVSNNGAGIASLPWEGVKILACHAGDNFNFPSDETSEPVVTSAAATDAIYYCIEKQTDVINMSFGVQGTQAGVGTTVTPDPLVQLAVQDAYQNGIVLVGSSGNTRSVLGSINGTTSPPVQFPANQPEVIAVGAVGSSGELAFYSNGGPELQFVAPGGNASGFGNVDQTQTIVTTDGLNSIFSASEGLPDGYVYSQGTSIAAGYVSGAIATLITQGARDATLSPTEQVERIRTILRKTAHSGFGGRTNDFGYGLIDPAAALQEFSPVIDVLSPTPNEDTASFAETLNANLLRPQLTAVVGGAPGDYTRTFATLDPGVFQVQRNGADITDAVQSDPLTGNILFTPDVQTRYNAGVNDLNVTVEDANQPDLLRSLAGDAVGHIPQRFFRIRVTPRVEQAGLRMISVPYTLQHDDLDPDHSPDNLTFLYGGNLVRLARWLPEQNRYAIYDVNGSPQEPEAALTTDAAGVAHPPVGIGFWARITDLTQVQLLGTQETSAFYEIPLQPGFNMIGDPYPFPVPWNTVSVRFGNQILSVSDAYNQKLMSNALWSYSGGRYTFQIAPNGSLQPWQGHWIRANTNLTLLVPRINAQTGQQASNRVVAPRGGGWKLALNATAGGKDAGQVVVGEARTASNGPDGQDLELPPAVKGAPEFRVRQNWRHTSGRFAQEIRSETAGVQRWNLEVETSKPGEVVKIGWNSLPVSAHASICVEGAARAQTMGSTGTVSFRAAQPGIHHVTLLAAAAPGTLAN